MIKVIKHTGKRKLETSSMAAALRKELPVVHREEMLLSLTDMMGYAVQEHPQSEQIALTHQLNHELLVDFYGKVKERFSEASYEFFNNGRDDISDSYRLRVANHVDEVLFYWEIKDFAVDNRSKPRNISLELLLTENGKMEFLGSNGRIVQKHELLNLALQGLLFYIGDHLELLLPPKEPGIFEGTVS